MERQAIMMNGFELEKCWFDLKNNGINKPNHALWTSTYHENPTKIGWIEWCMYEMREWIKNELYMITPKQDINVYTIDSLDDYKSNELIKIKNIEFPGMAYYIDYEAMAKKGYDGIHFTEAGAWLGHSFGHDTREDWNISIALNPIDCESTVWFNTDWISSVKRVTTTLKKDIEEYKEVVYL